MVAVQVGGMEGYAEEAGALVTQHDKKPAKHDNDHPPCVMAGQIP